MKKLIYTLLLAISCTISYQTVNAQTQNDRTDRSERMKDIEAMKVAFLTKKLSLTPEEAKVFWPVYDEYAAEMKSLRGSRMQNYKDAKGEIDNMSDKDVEKFIQDDIALRQQEVDLLKKYHPRFKQILPIKKVAKLYKAEEEFKRELLDKIRERKAQGKGGMRR
jgi:LTXXQ motif family protein